GGVRPAADAKRPRRASKAAKAAAPKRARRAPPSGADAQPEPAREAARGRRLGAKAPSTSLWPRIYAVVARVPRGRVVTYGQVAALAGLPRQARLVGYAMHGLPDGSTLPWHRVINAQGKVSLRSFAGPSEGLQRHLLEEEGVAFDDNGRVSLKRFRWKPRASSVTRAHSAAAAEGAGKPRSSAAAKNVAAKRPAKVRR
ncbi:MAG TPA: MGMT family protein, partial [Thermoanaerobaculia bacterium]|nr:MGMT family protein [Thermoanaerobaculia bacterium]